MLDQNTDRMWYVIGALVVGAGIILLANGTLPSLFASVTETFEGTSTEALNVIDSLYATNLVNPEKADDGYWVVEGSGVESTASNGDKWASTDYMMVSSNVAYTFKTAIPMYNMRITYFDANKKHITGMMQYHVDEMEMVAPSNAMYARISAPFTHYAESAPTTHWWFGRTSDIESFDSFIEGLE